MRKFITTIPPAQVLTDIKTELSNLTTLIDPFKINLTNDEKLGSRSMGQGREGYVRLVSGIATQFPNSLSRSDEPQELSDMLHYFNNLKAVKTAALQILETVDETLLGASMDIMKISDRYVENLQISRRNEGSLDFAMKEVDNYNKRFGQRYDAENTNEPESPII